MYSVTLWRMNSKRGCIATGVRLSRDPVMKLSMPITSQSCASRNSHRWEPMNPAAPVTSTLIVALRLAPVIPARGVVVEDLATRLGTEPGLLCQTDGDGSRRRPSQDGLAADRVVLEPQAAHALRLPEVAAVEEHRPP